MTFKNLQDRVLDRLNLSSTEARTRIKNFLNERYRKLATSVGLGDVRWTTTTFPTVIGTFTYSPTGIIKPLTLVYTAESRVLLEKTMDEVRLLDPDNSTVGAPEFWALQKMAATGCTVYLWPKPDAIYTVQIDGIGSGTDMSADGDVPAFPEDFHDALLYAASADELMKMEKPSLAQEQELKAEQRTRDLRYFIHKSAYLDVIQGSTGSWWAGPWGTYWRNFWS